MRYDSRLSFPPSYYYVRFRNEQTGGFLSWVSTKEKKSIFTFDNPMMYSVELKLKNNILTLIYYSNFVEDFSDLNSAKVINFDYQE